MLTPDLSFVPHGPAGGVTVISDTVPSCSRI